LPRHRLVPSSQQRTVTHLTGLLRHLSNRAEQAHEKCRIAGPSAAPDGERPKRETAWLGRQESNLGMAESKAAIEKRFIEDKAVRCSFMNAHNLKLLDRQFPVGVFDGIPTKASAIFTGGKSAIDLVGIGHDSSFWLFELKAEKNIKVGALSELFFYSMVVRDVLLRRFGFDDRKPDSRATIFPEHVQAAKQTGANAQS